MIASRCLLLQGARKVEETFYIMRISHVLIAERSTQSQDANISANKVLWRISAKGGLWTVDWTSTGLNFIP